jgi:hypothetical protein
MAVVGGLGAFQVVAFGYALRRYLVGLDGPWWPTSNVRNGWHPPLPGLVLDLLAAALFALLAWFAAVVVGGPRRRDPTTSPRIDEAEMGSRAIFLR